MGHNCELHFIMPMHYKTTPSVETHLNGILAYIVLQQ